MKRLDGTCVRDYVHVDDIAQRHEAAMKLIEPGKGQCYNLGSGTGATVLEVLRTAEQVVGRPIPHEIVGRRPGDPGVLVATPERAIKNLCWKPTLSDLNTILTSAWRWHSTHPAGYSEAS